jgi:hypothetical protein
VFDIGSEDLDSLGQHLWSGAPLDDPERRLEVLRDLVTMQAHPRPVKGLRHVLRFPTRSRRVGYAAWLAWVNAIS